LLFQNPLHPVNGGAEKEKDRVLHENVPDVQDPCFFWATLRLAALACRFQFRILCCFQYPGSASPSAALLASFLFITPEYRMLERVFRVRAARVT
jgi:hypothetical protein